MIRTSENRVAPREEGFTLVELLLVVSIIALAAGATIAVTGSLSSGRNVASAGEATAGALRQAQARAAAMVGDDTWSVRITSESATVFKGTDFSARDTDEDRVTSFAAPLTVAGTEDVVFVKGTLVPVTVASTSLSADGRWWFVRVNAEGHVSHGTH